MTKVEAAAAEASAGTKNALEKAADAASKAAETAKEKATEAVEATKDAAGTRTFIYPDLLTTTESIAGGILAGVNRCPPSIPIPVAPKARRVPAAHSMRSITNTRPSRVSIRSSPEPIPQPTATWRIRTSSKRSR